MKTIRGAWSIGLVVLLSVSTVRSADDLFKADNVTPLNDAGSWEGGIVPSATNTAVWDSRVGAANTVVDLGGALTWDGVRIANPGGPVTVNGTARLTLDGGAANDIDLSAATQDLTLNTPVTLNGTQVLDVGAGHVLSMNGPALLGGTGSLTRNGAGTVVFAGSTTNQLDSYYTAGRTVYSGEARATAITSLRGGDVTISGPYNSISSSLEALSLYTGTLVLDGPASALTCASRFFVGRVAAPVTSSEALMIVSNGTHLVTGGTPDAAANFIGVTRAKRGRLYIEGGSLTMPVLRLATNTKADSDAMTDELVINGGRLTVTNATLTFLMGTAHANDGAEASRSGLLKVTGGRFEVPNGAVQISTDGGATQSQTQNVHLAGGVLSVKKITVGSKATAVKNFWFNGGVLQATNTAAEADLIDGSTVNATFYVQSRGLLVDSGSGSVRLSRNLVEDPASPGGGVVKLGSGRLTLGGTNTYSGATIVSNGTFCLSGTLAVTNLAVAPGACLSLADGALSVFAPSGLTIGSATQASQLELDVASSGSDCDTLVVPAGAEQQKIDVFLFEQGTRNPVLRAGDFPIVRYAGPTGWSAWFTWANPARGFVCTFEPNAATRTIVAKIRPDTSAGESVWISRTGGAWENAGNWNTAPVSGAGTRAVFGDAPAAPSAVSLNTSFTVGQATLSNANAYTFSGAGSLVFDNGASPAKLNLDRGAHTVALPVSISSSLTVATASGTTLTAGGPISGPGAFLKQGSGELVVTSANSFSGGTTLTGGILSLTEGASLGTGPINIAVFEGRLRATGAGTVAITNAVVIAASGGALDAYNGTPMVVTGPLDWAPGQNTCNKFGTGQLTFKGKAVESGDSIRLTVRTGHLRVSDGGSIAVNNATTRETLDMDEDTDVPRTFAVDAGGSVLIGGMMTGGAPSNTVHVNGGSLTLSGTSEVGLFRGSLGTTSSRLGTDRIIVDSGTLTMSANAWLSFGVRYGNAEMLINGGTTTVGRLSLGTRMDPDFDSLGNTRSRIEVNSGLLDVVGALNWMGDINVGRTNRVVLNGGTLRLPATVRSQLAVANRSEFTLNGGTLELRGLDTTGQSSLTNYLNGLNALFVDQGGAGVDTRGNTVTITQSFQRVGTTTGGLAKRGAGALTLAGACEIGAVTVEAGALRFAATTATTALSVSNGAALSLLNGAYDTLTLSSVSLASGARLDLEVATAGTACDQIVLPSGAAPGSLVIGLYNVGTATPVTGAATFPIFSYSGTAPDVSGWTLAPEFFGVTCAFVVNEGAHTIDAQIAFADTQATWAYNGSGNWSDSGKWWPLAPAVSNAVVRFGNALAAPATVAVDGPVSVAGMIFDHTVRYTLSGSAVTLSNGVSVLSGAHTLASPLTLSGVNVAAVAPGAELRITDVASGSGSLTVTGGGQLTLDGTNTTATTVSGGATVAVPDAESLGGAALTLDGGALSVATSDTLGGTVSLGASGGSFRAGAGQTLQLDATVSGSGGLTKAGSGTVILGASADGYAGATTSDGGTLSVAELPAGALVLGRGTLAFTGASGSSAQPVTLASGTHAAVLRADGDVTLSGPFASASGAFFKSGTGTVTIAGANTNRIGIANAANMSGLAATGADGDGPSAGFGAFNVAQGRVTLGVAGQTNTISGALLVGLNTTSAAGAETAGELVIAGGRTTCSDWTYVGRNNGTTVTAPGGLASRLLVQSGELSTLSLSLGGAPGFAGYNGRPVVEIQGGTCTVDDLFYVGEAAGGASTVWVNGGTLRHLVGVSGTSLRLGYTGGEGILRVSAGSAEFAKDIVLASNAGTTGTVELAGGTLTAQNIYKLNASGYGRILFNGGVFRPTGGAMSGLDAAKIGAAPAIFDTSLSVYTAGATGYNLAQALSGADATDGGFIKAGTNALNVTVTQAYTGPTVVSGGVLRVIGALPAASALTVAPGARLALNQVSAKKVTVSALTLGDASSSTPAELEFGIDANNATNDQIAATGTLTAHRAAFYFYWQSSQTDNIVPNGKYALIRYTGADPSPAAFSVANPMIGKTYTFSAENQTVYVQVGAATSGAYVWTSAGGGDWSETAKWAAAPGAGAAGAGVRFDTAIASPATVRVNQNTTLGGLCLNSTNAYTLSSDGVSVMTLNNGTNAASIQVELGRHQVSTALALENDLNAKPISGTALTLAGPVSGTGSLVKMNGGDLVLGAANTYSGATRLTSGSLILTNGATVGAGTLALEPNNAQVRVSGTAPSVLTNAVAVRTSAQVVNVDALASLTLRGTLSYEFSGAATIIKQGAGELALGGSANAPTDNARLNIQEGALRFASGANYRIGNVQTNTIEMTTDNSRSRTLAVDAGATATLAGITTAYGTNTIVVDGALAFSGTSDAVILRNQSSLAEDRFTVRTGGSVTVPQSTWVNVGVRGPAVLAVEGGAAQLGSVSLGYENGGPSYGGGYGRIFVTGGGVLDVTGRFNWNGDYTSNRVNNVFVGNGASAGTLRLPPTTNAHTLGWASLALDGGTLALPGGGLYGLSPTNYLRGLHQLYVGGAGGTFDTVGQSVTVAQAVCSDRPGGSLAKAGLGQLTFAQPVRWDGTVDVQGGTLSAALASSARQSFPSNLLGRYSFENGPVADTSGNGRHGAAWGGAITPVVDPADRTGINIPAGSIVIVPMDAGVRGMDTYTVATWVKVASTNGGGTVSTFFTTRMGNSTDAYQIMLRVLEGKLYYMASGPSGGWPTDYRFASTLTVPAGTWFHAVCAVTASGLKLYVNGQPAGSWTKANLKFCPPTRRIGDLGFGFGHPYLTTSPIGEFAGQLDEFQIYNRALSDAEVAALAADPSPALPSLRVAGGASFVGQGATNTVQDLSGEGYVAGALKVRGSVAPGDSTNALAGAVLMAEDLTFGTNSVYRWTWAPESHDELQVGRLAIDGAGVLDFGRTESNPVSGPFQAVLMRYNTLEGASNFAGWTFANVGRKGFVAQITAADGEVILTFLSARGTFMILR